MIRRAAYAACLALLIAPPALATITSSPVPKPRPFDVLRSAPSAPPRAFVAPAPRVTAPRPQERPNGLRKIFGGAKSQPPKAAIKGQAGKICGAKSIQGVSVPPIPGRLAGCGVDNPVRVTAVSGVALSTPATMDCPTARALGDWVDKAAKPAFRKKGGGLVKLKVAAGYACRTRNNQPGAKISEHGRGRAIDISGFYLRDGTLVTVLDGWNQPRYARPLRKVHKAACGPFGTVLGPKANRFHLDHFHFDTAHYRSGAYCR